MSEGAGTVTGPEPDATTPPRPSPAQHARAWWYRLRRAGIGRWIVVAVVAATIGFAAGRGTAPTGDPDARPAIEAAVIPLVLDADGIWTSGSADRPPVSEALVLLRRDGEASLVEEHLDEWLNAYDAILVRLAGVDLPPTARPVQRQFMAAVTLSRDAVQLLGHAATVEDPIHRDELIVEVGRLRQRAEQLTQAARASALDLDGQRTDVSPLPSLPPPDVRRSD